MRIKVPKENNFFDIDGAAVNNQIQVVGGAAAWIADASLAATDVPDTAVAILTISQAAASQAMGVRDTVGTLGFVITGINATFITRLRGVHAVDVYREAADTIYYIVGYWL